MLLLFGVLVICRNGFEPERIEVILHKIELGLKHQSEKFGLNLGVVSIQIITLSQKFPLLMPYNEPHYPSKLYCTSKK